MRRLLEGDRRCKDQFKARERIRVGEAEMARLSAPTPVYQRLSWPMPHSFFVPLRNVCPKREQEKMPRHLCYIHFIRLDLFKFGDMADMHNCVYKAVQHIFLRIE